MASRMRSVLGIALLTLTLPWWALPSTAAPLCPGSQPPFITDFNVYQTPSMPEPAPRTPYRDPVFGTCVVRVTDRVNDKDPSDTSEGLLNEYSRVQAFNANETRIMVRSTDAFWYVYDAATLTRVAFVNIQADMEPRWDATDPDLFTYILDTRLQSYRMSTGQSTLLHDFASDFSGWGVIVVGTGAEGSPALDGRTFGLMAIDSSWTAVAFLVYDRATDQITALRDLRGIPNIGVNNVTIAPKGDYFVAELDNTCASGLGTDAAPCGTMVYTPALTNGRGIVRDSPHGDVALDATGNEVFLYQDNATDHISMANLATGAVTDLLTIDFSTNGTTGLHFSGRGILAPGWGLISTHDAQTTDTTWMDDQLFAVELKANPNIVRFAHTHSLVDPVTLTDYWAEPQATTNRDMTRLLFHTNWGRYGTAQVEMFLVELPAGWAGQGHSLFTGPGPGAANANLGSIWSLGGTPRASFTAYGAGKFGTRVGGGEIDADGEAEALTGPGPGDVYGPQVRAWNQDGTTLAKVNFYAYGTLRYGVNVAAGTIDADAFQEILTGAGPGAVFGPHVRGFNFDGASVSPIAKVSFFAYATLKYGVNVDVGSVDGDAYEEILTGPGPSGSFGSQLRGFNYDGASITAIGGLNSFLFPPSTYGLVVASGNLDGDSFEEIVASRGPASTYASEVKGFNFDGTALTAIAGVDFVPFTGATAGARVASGLVDGDAYAEILVGAGPLSTSTARVRGYDVDGGTATPMPSTDFDAYPTLSYGVDVEALELP